MPRSGRRGSCPFSAVCKALANWASWGATWRDMARCGNFPAPRSQGATAHLCCCIRLHPVASCARLLRLLRRGLSSGIWHSREPHWQFKLDNERGTKIFVVCQGITRMAKLMRAFPQLLMILKGLTLGTVVSTSKHGTLTVQHKRLSGNEQLYSAYFECWTWVNYLFSLVSYSGITAAARAVGWTAILLVWHPSLGSIGCQCFNASGVIGI